MTFTANRNLPSIGNAEAPTLFVSDHSHLNEEAGSSQTSKTRMGITLDVATFGQICLLTSRTTTLFFD